MKLLPAFILLFWSAVQLAGCASSAQTVTPTPVPSLTRVAIVPSATHLVQPSETPTRVPTATQTNTPSPTTTLTASPVPTLTNTPTDTYTPTVPLTATKQAAPTRTRTPLPMLKMVDGKIDVCSLFSKSEIEMVLGAPIGEVKAIAGADPPTSGQPIPQCDYLSSETFTGPDGSVHKKHISISFIHPESQDSTPIPNPPPSAAEIVASSTWFWVPNALAGILGMSKNGLSSGFANGLNRSGSRRHIPRWRYHP